MKVLIGYSSEHGSTAGIAERLAAGVTAYGHLADVRAMDTVEDMAGCDAFVLGRAIHGGEWLPDAAAFLRAHENTLATRPVWLFSVGLARALGGEAEKAAKEPKTVTAVRRTVRPRVHWLLAGAIERDHVPLFGRAVFRMMSSWHLPWSRWWACSSWASATGRSSPWPPGRRDLLPGGPPPRRDSRPVARRRRDARHRRPGTRERRSGDAD